MHFYQAVKSNTGNKSSKLFKNNNKKKGCEACTDLFRWERHTHVTEESEIWANWVKVR